MMAGLAMLLASAQAEEPGAPASAGPQPLDDRARAVLAGNWVEIESLSADSISARLPWCDVVTFDRDEMWFTWTYNEKLTHLDIPVLRDAAGSLSLRWNGNDDLYISTVKIFPSSVPERTYGFKGPTAVSRVTGATMELSESVLGVVFAPAQGLSWAEPPVSAGRLLAYGMTAQRLTNRETGDSVLIAQFPMGADYNKNSATKLYAKCG